MNISTLSKVHSHLPATHMRKATHAMDSFKVNGLPDLVGLAQLGIHVPPRIALDMVEAARKVGLSVAMDAALQPTVTTGSIPGLIQFLQQWLPGFVEIITAARNIDLLVGISTVGQWEDEQVVQGIMEPLGTAVPYSDSTNVPRSSWNLNYEWRTIVRFEEGMHVGRLEEARAARVRANDAEMKRNAASTALEIQRNRIGFFGYNNGLGRTYGFLNDPNLLAYGTVSGGTWASKTMLEIIADLLTAIVQLRTQSQDQINPKKTPLTLAIATDCVDFLSTPSDLGYSVQKWLTDNYNNIAVESAPELNLANGGANVFYLYANDVTDNSTDDRRVFMQPVPAKFMVLGVKQETKGYEEDYSNATAGVMCKRPYAVTRWSGI